MSINSEKNAKQHSDISGYLIEGPKAVSFQKFVQPHLSIFRAYTVKTDIESDILIVGKLPVKDFKVTDWKKVIGNPAQLSDNAVLTEFYRGVLEYLKQMIIFNYSWGRAEGIRKEKNLENVNIDCFREKPSSISGKTAQYTYPEIALPIMTKTINELFK